MSARPNTRQLAARLGPDGRAKNKAAAAESLQERVRDLSAAVAVFQTGQVSGGTRDQGHFTPAGEREGFLAMPQVGALIVQTHQCCDCSFTVFQR